MLTDEGGLSIAPQIRANHAKLAREVRHPAIECFGGFGNAMQQHDNRCVLPPIGIVINQAGDLHGWRNPDALGVASGVQGHGRIPGRLLTGSNSRCIRAHTTRKRIL